ncbi:MAG: hypothetical protein B7Y70_10920 [Rhizobiales bacterium 35-68-8]|nr:MAG: hypothetical protein B7Y70_10920 [Rhizobiales bacterium 35-68-8]
MNVVQKRLVQTLCILLAGSAIVSFGAVTSYNSSYAAMEYLRFLGICFGTLAAAGAAGAFLGFLFGVPRLLQRVNGGDGPKPKEAGFNNLGAGKTTRTVAGNSNLEEISDWLTKIIVGLALVNAYEILGLGRRIVSFLSRFGGVDSNLAKAYFACLIIAGFVACFLAIYLEARTRLTFILADIEQLLDGALDEDAIAAANEAPILISSGMTDLSRTPAPPIGRRPHGGAGSVRGAVICGRIRGLGLGAGAPCQFPGGRTRHDGSRDARFRRYQIPAAPRGYPPAPGQSQP